MEKSCSKCGDKKSKKYWSVNIHDDGTNFEDLYLCDDCKSDVLHYIRTCPMNYKQFLASLYS